MVCKMIAVYFLLAGVAQAHAVSEPASITKFIQVPHGTVAPGTKVIYICETSSAVRADLFINNTHIMSGNSPNREYNASYNTISYGMWNITLTTRATIEKNNTRVKCLATGNIGGQMATGNINISIAGPPLAPQPEAQVLSGGHVINISWEEPYSHDTFPILFYNLTIQNQTENSSFSEMLPDTVLSYNIVKNSVSTTCHTLTFVLTACNSIGVSDEGNDTGGFPVVPEVQELMMQYNVTFIEDVTLLYIYFQEPEVCAYQEPANYILVLHNESHEVASHGPKPAIGSQQSHIILENFTRGIQVNQHYVAILTISLPGEFTLNTSIQVFSSHSSPATTTPSSSSSPATTTSSSSSSPATTTSSGDVISNTHLLIISMVSPSVAIVACVVLVIIILGLCACKKGRRPIIAEHIDIPLQSVPTTPEFKLAPPPKGKKVPTSLPPMAVNPIYQGVTYDSPGGESFKSLLGNCSVPSTPLDPCTPLGEANPRYFDMPPSLPPPRKASVSMRPHPPPEGIPEEDVESTCIGKDGYGEMTRRQPASCIISRPPNVPPAVYEAMQGGDYETIRK